MSRLEDINENMSGYGNHNHVYTVNTGTGNCKICKIASYIQTAWPFQLKPHCSLSEIDHVSNQEVFEYVLKSLAKSCLLDPIQTWMKQNVNVFVPVITAFINKLIKWMVLVKNFSLCTSQNIVPRPLCIRLKMILWEVFVNIRVFI